MDFKAAVSFCEQNLEHTLYALNIDESDLLAIYSLRKLSIDDDVTSLMFTEVEGEIFDDMACENDYDLDVAAELTKGLVFFSGRDMENNEEDFPGFLMEMFPSLLKYTNSMEGFVKHAIHCVRSFNVGAVEIGQGAALGGRKTIH